MKFAAKDANDVASALFATQGSEFNKLGGLYAEVLTQYLHDSDADRAGIISALGSMKTNMAKDEPGQDLAVILFSGHGAIIDDRFYLFPMASTQERQLKSRHRRLSANDFHDEVVELAKYGRVLVLLDACHSGAATGDGSTLTSNADLLRSTIVGQQRDGADVIHFATKSPAKMKSGTMARSPKCCSTHWARMRMKTTMVSFR